MKTKTINLYAFYELSESAKQKAIENLSDINVDFEWWESTYEDGQRIGLIISEFETDRFCNGHFKGGAEETAHLIEKEHGENCETFKTAKAYLAKRDTKINGWPKNEDGENENEGDLDDQLDELDNDFQKSLLEDYRIILRKEYEYLTSSEAIIETIEANDYTFTENGKLENA